MRPGLRTKGVKKVSKKLPSGRLATHFKKEKPSHHKCGVCRAPLQGLPRLKPIRYSSLNKSARTVSRKFGGYLCSKCARETIKKSVRVSDND
jgi:large subunit ribosomal protein L34e